MRLPRLGIPGKIFAFPSDHVKLCTRDSRDNSLTLQDLIKFITVLDLVIGL